MSSQILLTLMIIPLIWSAGLNTLLRLTRSDTTPPDDTTEKQLLVIALAPVGLGLLLMGLSFLTPLAIPDLGITSALPVSSGSLTPTPPAPLTAGPVPFDFKALWARLASVVLIIYGLGVAYRSLSLMLSFERLRRLVARSTPTQIAGHRLRVTDDHVPPMAWGRSTIILPMHLIAHFNEAHLSLIIQHEGAHLRRGDSFYFALLSWVEALFWYNPFVRLQTQRCRMAAELACDADVLSNAPTMREVYARTLVQTLKHTAGDVRQYAPAVFSHFKSGDYRMRISEIMHANPKRSKPRRKWVYAMLAFATLPLAYAQVACSQSPAAAATPDKAPVYALSDGIVTVVSNPVASVSDSKVTFQTVQVDNGDGIKTTYSTFGGTILKVGDKVVKGQLVSQSGNVTQANVSLLTGSGTLKGIKCLSDTANSCGYSLQADAISGFNDSLQFIATGRVSLRLKGRIISADTIFSDPKAELATAQGNIRIEKE